MSDSTIYGWYRIVISLGGMVVDTQMHRADRLSLSTYVREMLPYGYGLDMCYLECDTHAARKLGVTF